MPQPDLGCGTGFGVGRTILRDNLEAEGTKCADQLAMEGGGVGGPEEDTQVSGLCLFHRHEQTLGAEKVTSYFCLINLSIITSPQFLYISLLNHLFIQQMFFKCQMYI